MQQPNVFRATCLAVLTLSGWLGLQSVWAAAERGPRRPNIILIITDDQRWDALGCMGNSIVHTPNIDRLAAEGAVFTNMFCTTSICATSRASFLTGQYARRHGVWDFRTPLRPDQFDHTFPVVLRKLGYRTGMVGKWGLGGPLPKEAYDEFYGFSGQGRYYPKDKLGQPGEHLTQKLAAQVLQFLDGCSPDQPFLLQYYTKAAHCQDGDPWPFQPDPRYNNLFRDVTIPLPKTATEKHFRALPKFLQTSEGRVRWRIRFATYEMFQKSVKDYYRLIAGIDDAVGQILKKLQEKGLADNTVIIFTSDNGFFLGEHGLAGKWFAYEESIRLPLVIYDPRLPRERRGSRIPQMALNIDIAPTIFDLAGADIPDDVQGRSLVPLLRGESVPWRTEFFYEHLFEHPRIPKSEGVRTERWKYVRYVDFDPPYEQLFDLKTDAYEEHDLARDPNWAAQLDQMRAKWRRWRERVK